MSGISDISSPRSPNQLSRDDSVCMFVLLACWLLRLSSSNPSQSNPTPARSYGREVPRPQYYMATCSRWPHRPQIPTGHKITQVTGSRYPQGQSGHRVTLVIWSHWPNDCDHTGHRIKWPQGHSGHVVTLTTGSHWSHTEGNCFVSSKHFVS